MAVLLKTGVILNTLWNPYKAKQALERLNLRHSISLNI